MISVDLQLFFVAEVSEFVVVWKCVGPLLCREFLSALFLLDLIASNLCSFFCRNLLASDCWQAVLERRLEKVVQGNRKLFYGSSIVRAVSPIL